MNISVNSFNKGALASSPLLTGVIPFGIICGVTCTETGLNQWEALGMSSIIFAGASQIVVTQLMNEQTPILIIVLTAFLINLRMLMYSASLAPHLNHETRRKRAFLSYFLTDQAYATSLRRFLDENQSPVDKPSFYLGAGLLMWTAFNVTTFLGASLGSLIPDEWELDFAIPLTFIALLVPLIKSRIELVTSVLAGGIAIAAYAVPLNLGLLLAAAAGISVGSLFELKNEQ